MEPLLVLLLSFVLTAIAVKFIKKQWLLHLPAQMAMSVMLLFTATGHFLFPDGMALMLPDFIPAKKIIIYITGVIEITAAVGLLVPRFKICTGWLLILFFIVILPANIYAAIHHVNIKTASTNGLRPEYLWFRIPLQLLFIIWVYYSVIKKVKINGKFK